MATPGDFSSTLLRNVRVRLSDIFGQNSMQRNLNRDTPVFNGLFGSQQIKLNKEASVVLTNGKHCEAVEVSFLTSCDLSVDDCTDDCMIPEGAEPCVDKDVFVPSICKEKIYRFREDECANERAMEERMALGVSTILASLDQEAERDAIAQLSAWAEDLTDVDLPVGGLDAGGVIWEIPSDEINAQLIVDLQCLLDDCEFIDPKIVTGKIWKKQVMLAEARDGNGCCHYDGLLGAIPTITNTRELDKIIGENTFFLVDNAKFGYFNRWIHTSRTPVNQYDDKNTHHYFMESPKLRFNINGVLNRVKYDFYWQRVCIKEDVYEIRIKGKHRGGYVCMPDGCEGEPNKKVIQIREVGCTNC